MPREYLPWLPLVLVVLSAATSWATSKIRQEYLAQQVAELKSKVENHAVVVHRVAQLEKENEELRRWKNEMSNRFYELVGEFRQEDT